MAYIANTEEDVRQMLGAIGVEDVEALFCDIPESVRLKSPPGPDRPLSEYETLRLMAERANLNRPAASAYSSFIGGGSYEHFIPSAVQALAQRGEILTAYTPYQAEASQGTLQIIYEFQSMICALTGMDAANASMYDGASALAEAVLMAVRITNRNRVAVAATLNPAYRDAIESYTRHIDARIDAIEADASRGGGVLNAEGFREGDDLAAIVIQHPNAWGYLEPVDELAARAKRCGALVIASANPMSLSALKPPGAWGADIAVGECQPIGLPMNFGGPYAGYLATRKEHLRKMPGRIVGRTADARGREGFTLTLQTREQHIRREKATSNICTNQGLCATMVTIHLALIGKEGFTRLGELNMLRAGQVFEGLTSIAGVRPLCDAPFFNEFTVRLPIEAEQFCEWMREEGILPGLPATRLGFGEPNLLIVCATETKLDGDVKRCIETAKSILELQA